MKFQNRMRRHDAVENAPEMSRRAALGRLGTLGIAAWLGKGYVKEASAATTGTATGSCILIPAETAGPFPLLAMLTNARMVRKDIREGKAGVPLTLDFRLLDIRNGCKPVSNAAVYIWHCDKDGAYSGYSNEENGNHAGETYLRGIQLSDANGVVSFTTIFPGWYPGRITHIHFQIYLHGNRNVTAAVTSQLTFPLEVIRTVYATEPYRARGQNASVRDYRDDGVFSDGADYQIAAVTGDPARNLQAALDVGIAE